ncbi:MAG TPA: hypothetical protein VG015_09625 [Candidatus Dormibacteraeota bacterium]|nr:hypothetical protein [Candidatus Dormibacteraeota bacterium]
MGVGDEVANGEGAGEGQPLGLGVATGADELGDGVAGTDGAIAVGLALGGREVGVAVGDGLALGAGALVGWAEGEGIGAALTLAVGTDVGVAVGVGVTAGTHAVGNGLVDVVGCAVAIGGEVVVGWSTTGAGAKAGWAAGGEEARIGSEAALASRPTICPPSTTVRATMAG